MKVRSTQSNDFCRVLDNTGDISVVVQGAKYKKMNISAEGEGHGGDDVSETEEFWMAEQSPYFDAETTQSSLTPPLETSLPPPLETRFMHVWNLFDIQRKGEV